MPSTWRSSMRWSSRDGERAAALMLHHIDHIEADLDLRVRAGLALKEALDF